MLGADAFLTPGLSTFELAPRRGAGGAGCRGRLGLHRRRKRLHDWVRDVEVVRRGLRWRGARDAANGLGAAFVDGLGACLQGRPAQPTPSGVPQPHAFLGHLVWHGLRLDLRDRRWQPLDPAICGGRKYLEVSPIDAAAPHETGELRPDSANPSGNTGSVVSQDLLGKWQGPDLVSRQVAAR